MSTIEVLSVLQDIASRLSLIEQHLGIEGSLTIADSISELPKSIRGFDTLCTESLSPFVDACQKLGGDAASVSQLVIDAFSELRKFLLMASACKQPAEAELRPFLAGLASKMKAIGGLCQKNTWEKHTKTVSEGIGCLNWVVVKPAPRDFIESFIGGSDYWANNIRREHRSTNPDQIAFCDTFKALLKSLMDYVKEHHTTGVKWNANGLDVTSYKPDDLLTVPSTNIATAGTPIEQKEQSKTQPAKAVDLFSAINKGGSITSGLKTVTKDQQTWRAEFKETAPPSVPTKAPTKSDSYTKDIVKGTPKVEYISGPAKWIVEYQSATSGTVTVQITGIKETVYILGCVGATINIIGKCKGITIDSCKKTRIMFDNIMASCEVVNSVRIHVECREKVSSVAIDKTDGIIVQLPASSLDTTIVTSKSSEMNVQFPDPNSSAATGGDVDLIERPIPEQYVHRVVGTSVTAEVSDLYGH